MPGFDDHDVEPRLRDERPEAREEFVEGVAAKVRAQRHPSARPRLTLAFALSLALLVSFVAFGGVGAASSALHSSTSAVKSAVGKAPKSRGSKAPSTPAKHQYKPKVPICLPKYRVAYQDVSVTKYRWVTTSEYKWVWKNGQKKLVKVKVRTKVPYQVLKKVRVKTVVYTETLIPQASVPKYVSKGAIYPVPAQAAHLRERPDRRLSRNRPPRFRFIAAAISCLATLVRSATSPASLSTR